MFYFLLLISILGLYIALTANIEINNLVVGVMISAMILALLRPKPRQLDWRKMPKRIWALIRYLALMLLDLLQSGVVVASIVLKPKVIIQPGILAIPTPGASEAELALTAHALTITPGELVVETGEDGTLYTHCLDATRGQETIQKAEKLRSDLLNKILM